jgi:hypothetical protein
METSASPAVAGRGGQVLLGVAVGAGAIAEAAAVATELAVLVGDEVRGPDVHQVATALHAELAPPPAKVVTCKHSGQQASGNRKNHHHATALM